MTFCEHPRVVVHPLPRRLDGGRQPIACYECVICWCVRFMGSDRWVARELAEPMIWGAGMEVPAWRMGKPAVGAPAPVCPECGTSPCIGHPRS